MQSTKITSHQAQVARAAAVGFLEQGLVRVMQQRTNPRAKLGALSYPVTKGSISGAHFRIDGIDSIGAFNEYLDSAFDRQPDEPRCSFVVKTKAQHIIAFVPEQCFLRRVRQWQSQFPPDASQAPPADVPMQHDDWEGQDSEWFAPVPVHSWPERLRVAATLWMSTDHASSVATGFVFGVIMSGGVWMLS